MSFPVTNSNLSAKHIAEFLKDKYALDNTTDCRFIRAGINDTYLVTDKEVKYVFRVYSFNWRTEEEISEEVKLLNLLKDNEISISYPIHDLNDNYIQILNAPEGDRFGVLFSYAEGEKIHNYPIESHFHIGQLMARLHVVTNGLKLKRVEYSPEILLVDSLTKLADFLPRDSEELTFMKATQILLLEEFSRCNTKAIRQGTVHLDIWFDNINIDKDNIATIFDFDFCGSGWLVLDLAYYIMQVHNIEKYDEKDYQPKVDSFLKGYESITKLSDEEKRIIPMLGVCLYYFYLGIQCQRFDNWSNSFLSENYLKRFINGLVKKYYEIYNKA